MASKKVVVTLNHFFIDPGGFDERDTADDVVFEPGDTLDIVGRLDIGRLAPEADGADAVKLASAGLFCRDAADPLSIEKGAEFSIESRAEMEIFTGEFLEFSGQLGGRDGVGDFDLEQPWSLRFTFDQVSPDVLRLGPFEVAGHALKVKMTLMPVTEPAATVK